MSCASPFSPQEVSAGTGFCDRCYDALAAKNLKRLPRAVRVYRWGPLHEHIQGSADDAGVAVRDERIKGFLRRLKEEFWDVDRVHSGCMAGLGVYCAKNALASMSYAGSPHWCVVQLVLPEGTPFLDIRTCPEQSGHFNSNNRWRQRRKVKLIQALGAQALLYDWNGRGAFVLCDDRSLNLDQMTVYTRHQSPTEPWDDYHARLLIQEQIKRRGGGRSLIESGLPWPPSHLASHRPFADDSEFAAWEQTNLFHKRDAA